MAETIEIRCDGVAKWHWFNIRDDLVNSGHVDRDLLVVDPFSMRPNSCSGQYDGMVFQFTWVHNAFVLLSMSRDVPELVDALTAVLEYKPFVSYMKDDYITYEWDKENPAGRLEVIRSVPHFSDIEEILERADDPGTGLQRQG